MVPALSHSLKIALLLGLGLGGHQVYLHLTDNNSKDWGLFSFGSQKPYSEEDLTKNKVYNSRSAITKEQESYSASEILDRKLTYHIEVDKGWDSNRNRLSLASSSEGISRSDIYELIRDHTVKLSMPCQAGTGWFLDFELPNEGQNYPMKWFVATNLHVIDKYRFKENPYHASLPVTEQSLYQLLSSPAMREAGMSYCRETIWKNTSFLKIYTQENEKDRERNSTILNLPRNHWRYSGYRYDGLVDVTSILGISNTPNVFYTTINNPKLVFAAVDFLGDNIGPKRTYRTSGGYFKDFGVLEIEFTSEKQARLMTNNVYDKYYKEGEVRQGRKLFIDFFAPELMTKYNPSELANSKDRYFIGGYPGAASENLLFHTNQRWRVKRRPIYDYLGNVFIDPNTEPESVQLSESKLTFFKQQDHYKDHDFNLFNSSGEIIPGHSDISAIDRFADVSKISWGGRRLSGWGYNYLIDNSFLGRGASGSMVLNQDGEMLGLYRMYNEFLNYGFVEPLRASWVVDKNGEIILPGFDLITGLREGMGSYRAQIERHKPDMQTYLKSKKWNLKS